MIHYDEIGVIHDIDTTDQENPISTPLDGWHVNTTAPIEGWEQYLVTPTTPRQIFAGLPTVCYRFPDEATYQLLQQGEENAEGSL